MTANKSAPSNSMVWRQVTHGHWAALRDDFRLKIEHGICDKLGVAYHLHESNRQEWVWVATAHSLAAAQQAAAEWVAECRGFKRPARYSKKKRSRRPASEQ